jgi:uncharacterized Fe-S center protein
MVGSNLPNRQLDKDLLYKGNKIYSKDTCVLVPHVINNIFNIQTTSRGEYPVGVDYLHRGKNHYRARYADGTGISVHIGMFNTAEEAFNAYKVYKERIIKQIALSYKHEIDPRVYDIMMNYVINIDD